MKSLVALDAKSLAEGGAGVLDREFIQNHTTGIDELLADLDATSWEAIEEASGLSQSDIDSPAISTPRRSGSSSTTAWESPSIVTARAMCSKSSIC